MASTVMDLFRDLEVPPWVVFSVVAGLVFIGWQFLFNGLDPREPPEVRSRIPFVGHLLGMLWYKAEYVTVLSRKVNLPIYTIRVMGTRMYILRSPELIQKTFANPKAFTFDTFAATAVRRLLNISEPDMKVLLQEPGPENRPSYSHDIHDLTHSTLTPSAALSQLNDAFQTRLAKSFNEIDTEGTTVNLHQWSRDVVTHAACAAILGPDNPYEDDPSLISALWDFETELVLLILRIFPTLTAPKGYQARARLTSAYLSYQHRELWKHGSALLQGRREIGKKHGFNDTQIAEWDLLFTIAAVTNAIPISFWMVSYILADPSLLSEVREELQAIVQMEELKGEKVLKLDPRMIRERCPLLISIWEELLRFTSQPTLGRYVTTDTVLNNEYLVKAGSVVQIPTQITQGSSSIWGPSASDFNPRRFLRKEENKKLGKEEREQERLQRRAYTPFGGGKNLCPGRHAAANETLSFVAMVVVAFTVEREDGGVFGVIGEATRAAGASVPKAEGDVRVVVRRREELRGVRLEFAGEER
ncbi:cytochrome P450 [Hyaloscypha variabilis]